MEFHDSPLSSRTDVFGAELGPPKSLKWGTSPADSLTRKREAYLGQDPKRNTTLCPYLRPQNPFAVTSTVRTGLQSIARVVSNENLLVRRKLIPDGRIFRAQHP